MSKISHSPWGQRDPVEEHAVGDTAGGRHGAVAANAGVGDGSPVTQAGARP